VLAAPVPESDPVTVMTTSTPGNGASLSVGYHWSDTWLFSTTCTGDSCKVYADPDIKWKLTDPYDHYPVTLSGSGRTYTGSAQVRATHCQSTWATDTLTLTISAKGAVVNGAWQAWTGTMVLTERPVVSGNSYCPQPSWTLAVTTTS
jgi:hypothetical protein